MPKSRIHSKDVLPFMQHALSTDPGGFHIAVSGGKILCFAITILREKTHFLSMFFALPGAQSHGIGRKVLTHAFGSTEIPQDAVRCLVASPDIRAQSLYLKFGMYPRTVVYHFTGKPSRARGTRGIELRQIGRPGQSTKMSLEVAARFDLPLREARRDVDQRFFMTSVRGSRFFEAKSGSRTVGYVIIRGNGVIGPAAAEAESQSEGILSEAISKASEMRLETVSAWVPGLNQGAIRAAFASGLKVDFTTVWMAARHIGNLQLYIPSGGLLF